MKLPLLSIFLIAVLCLNAGSAEPDRQTSEWIQKVLLGPEFGGTGAVCSKWTKPPSVSVHGGTPDQQRLITFAVGHLNRTLEGTKLGKLTMRPPDSEADIYVYFAPLEKMPELARRLKFRYVEGNWGYFWTFWGRRNEISRAYVLLANDMLKGEALQHFALEELTQALGLSNDSPVFRDSIFYAEGDNGGNAQRLSALDQKLLAFFYNHVTPGMNGAELREALEKHW